MSARPERPSVVRPNCSGVALPRLADDASERRLRELLAALRREVLEAQGSKRRRSIRPDVVVEAGQVSDDSAVEARHYSLSAQRR